MTPIEMSSFSPGIVRGGRSRYRYEIECNNANSLIQWSPQALHTSKLDPGRFNNSAINLIGAMFQIKVTW